MIWSLLGENIPKTTNYVVVLVNDSN